MDPSLFIFAIFVAILGDFLFHRSELFWGVLVHKSCCQDEPDHVASFLKQIYGSSMFDFMDFAQFLHDLDLPEFLQIRKEKFEFWEKSFGSP